MFDVIVIGARCAGSPLAMLLAQGVSSPGGGQGAIPQRYRIHSRYLASRSGAGQAVGSAGPNRGAGTRLLSMGLTISSRPGESCWTRCWSMRRGRPAPRSVKAATLTEADRFFGRDAGTIPMTDFFAPDNLYRIVRESSRVGQP